MPGVYPSPHDPRDYHVGTLVKDVRLPLKVDNDHLITRVRDQGYCGTCVGKAAGAMLSAALGTDLSSLYIYARCKEKDGIPHLQGTYPRIALKVMHRDGACPDKMLPYSKLKSCTETPTLTQAMADAAAANRIDSYARLWTLFEIKRALAGGCLSLAAVFAGRNWWGYKGGVLGPPDMSEGEYHAVILTGYDDELRAFRGVNSWGEDWGEDGYFWLSYNAFTNNEWFLEAWGIKYTLKEDDDMIKDMDKIPYDPNKPAWKSKKWWAAGVAFAIPVLNLALGWEIDPAYVWAIISPILAVILGQAAVDSTH